MRKDVVLNRTDAVKCLGFTFIHTHEVSKEKTHRLTHKQSGLKTDVLNQRRSTRVLISFISCYIFVLIASCIFTMHFCSVLPCLVKTKKNTTCITAKIYCGLFSC